MSQIEKGAPNIRSGPAKSKFGISITELAETAFADKGEWYSIARPDGPTHNTLYSMGRFAMARQAGDLSLKDRRVWIRFYKDSDASE